MKSKTVRSNETFPLELQQRYFVFLTVLKLERGRKPEASCGHLATMDNLRMN